MIPLQHLHPAIVHFPIVLIFTAAALDLWSMARGRPLGTVSAGIGIAAGAFAVLAAMLGDAAAEIAIDAGVPEAVIETHETLGMITAAGLGLLALIRLWGLWRRKMPDGGARTGLVAAELAMVLLVTATAFFGGSLVYNHGVNVAVIAAR